MLNVVAIMGRLVADPELRTTTAGHSVCSFRIACDRSYVQQGQERQADFIDIVAWRQQADFVSKYFQKGSMIAVEGSLQTRNYQDKNGNSRTAVEVVANNISFAGAKRQDGQSTPSYEQQTTSHVQQAKAAQNAPQPAYTQGSMDDFAVIDDNDDLPF
nr:MAG TPA: Single strand binding protein [Caudoviricetes sp.]